MLSGTARLWLTGSVSRLPHPPSPSHVLPALQCRTELGVLPVDHPQRTDALLRR